MHDAIPEDYRQDYRRWNSCNQKLARKSKRTGQFCFRLCQTR
jgi:hypothetical protein